MGQHLLIELKTYKQTFTHIHRTGLNEVLMMVDREY